MILRNWTVVIALEPSRIDVKMKSLESFWETLNHLSRDSMEWLDSSHSTLLLVFFIFYIKTLPDFSPICFHIWNLQAQKVATPERGIHSNIEKCRSRGLSMRTFLKVWICFLLNGLFFISIFQSESMFVFCGINHNTYIPLWIWNVNPWNHWCASLSLMFGLDKYEHRCVASVE